MACQGPDKKRAEAEADKAFAEITKLLKDKYHVSSEDMLYPTLWGKDYAKANRQLRATLRELFWVDACDSF
jgi:hypothetical protein